MRPSFRLLLRSHPNRPPRRFGLCISAPWLLGALCLLLLLAGAASAQSEAGASPLDDLYFAWEAVWEGYADPAFGGIDWEGLRDRYAERVAAAEGEEAAYELIAEMLDQLGDPLTFIVPPWLLQPAAEGAAEPELEFAGVGIVIQQMETGEIMVINVFPGTPAEEAGVLVGDVILGVDDWEPAEGDSTEEVAERIRGPVGAPVALKLKGPGEEPRSVVAVRGRIDLRPAVEHRRLEGGLGYLRLPNLSAEMAERGAQALPFLLGTSGLILDLRGVEWGEIGGLVRAAQWFLGAADLGSYRGRAGDFQVPYVVEAIAAYRAPVAVLIDRRTSGLPEVLALLLREYGRARLVGEPTAGAYHLGNQFELPSGGLMQMTVAHYITPTAALPGPEGLEPDAAVFFDDPDALLLELRAGRDPALERAAALLRGD